jgi:hypothetical protein
MVSKMTPEQKWFNRMKKCLEDMPEGIEFGIFDRTILYLKEGEYKKCMDDKMLMDAQIDSQLFERIFGNDSFY